MPATVPELSARQIMCRGMDTNYLLDCSSSQRLVHYFTIIREWVLNDIQRAHPFFHHYNYNRRQS